MYQAAGNQFILGSGLPTPALAANTLPRDIATFAGRTQELDDLIATVTQLVAAEEPLPVFTIDGMPGVGKTTFAVHIGHMLSLSFPDGQMFVDMRAHTDGKVPVEPEDALFALLSVDGVPGHGIPDGVDGRSALWRARMAGRRSILIIDNVGSHQQVEPLLPGSASCLVLVTSRRRLTGLGARYAATAMPLDPLPSDSAVDLFSRLTGRAADADNEQEQAMVDLVRLCGHLPLAIALLAARLRPEPRWRVRTLVDDLAAARDRLAYMQAEDIQVAAAFHISYRRLPNMRRRFFRSLGMNPGLDFDAYAAAALAGVGLPTARRHLDSLYDDHLVEQPVQGRYRLHDLVGEYARAMADREGASQQDRAVGRLTDYYQHVAGVADRYLTVRRPQAPVPTSEHPPAMPGLAGAAQATTWLNVELPNLLACATYAMRNGDDGRLISLSATLATFLRRAGPHRQSVTLYRSAAEAAARCGDRSARAAALYQLGVLLRRAGDYQAATGVLIEARGLHRDLGNRVGEADVLTAAGVVRRLAGDYPTAIGMLDEALERYRELGDVAGQAETFDELAVVRWLTDDYPAASELLDQALALYGQAGNSQGQADVLLHLGIVRRLKHDYPAAVRALQQATNLYSGLSARAGLANTQFMLGMVRRLGGDHIGAIDSLEQSLQVYGEVGDRLGQANALKELGILRRQSGDHPGATQALLESLSVYQDLGNRIGQAGTLQQLGVLWRLTDNSARAGQDFTAALTIYREHGSRTGQAEVLNDLGALLLDTRDPLARERFQAALELAREVQNPLAEARALEGIAQCSTYDGSTEEAIRQLQAALEIYRRIGAPEAAQAEGKLASLVQPTDAD